MARRTHIKGLKKYKAQLKDKIKQREAEARRSVAVGYTANYALYVHENVQMRLAGKPRPNNRGSYWDPQGKAGPRFLTGALRDNLPELRLTLNRVVKQTGSVTKGILAAGLLLQRKSQERVPVDTGNLRSSAFTRLLSD